jgi:hypothetical protein
MRSMVGRVPERSPDGQGGAAQPDNEETAPADRRPDDEAEREKAETEIAAGDVADDLADFA